jgi:hypothetical protein
MTMHYGERRSAPNSDHSMYFGEVMYYHVLLPNAHLRLCTATILQLLSVTLALAAIRCFELIHYKLLIVILYNSKYCVVY